MFLCKTMLYEVECWPVKNSSSKYESGGNKEIKVHVCTY